MAYTPRTLKPVGYPGLSADGRDTNISLLWTYKTSDAIATVNTAGYFADAKNRRLIAGDHIQVTVMSGATVSAVYKATVMSVTAGAANISDGVSETLTDSD